MTADGKELIRESDKVIYQSKGSEANKLYKINGTYYHFFSEVKKDGRAIMMQRSKNIYGPYTEVKQLSHAQKEFHEPNQGGIIKKQKGDWYFLTHHGTGDWSGRIMSLLPVTWVNGWPIIGEPGTDTIGRMVWTGKIPAASTKNFRLQTSDEFNNKTLSQQWEWNYQPRADKWSLTERKGWLRLHAFVPLENDNMLKAGNILTQRSFRTEKNEVVVKLDISRMTDGQKAGFAHFGSPNYAAFGVVCNGTEKVWELNVKGVSTRGPQVTGNVVWIRSTWGLVGKSQFYYSEDGKNFSAFGNPYQLMWGFYRGSRLAIYCYNNLEEKGSIDVDFFHYNYEK
jgi:beta-xylosidase